MVFQFGKVSFRFFPGSAKAFVLHCCECIPSFMPVHPWLQPSEGCAPGGARHQRPHHHLSVQMLVRWCDPHGAHHHGQAGHRPALPATRYAPYAAPSPACRSFPSGCPPPCPVLTPYIPHHPCAQAGDRGVRRSSCHIQTVRAGPGSSGTGTEARCSQWATSQCLYRSSAKHMQGKVLFLGFIF